MADRPESWNNGAVLFVFVQDHKMRIQTGYGLEGALPDITCQSILHDRMAPLQAGRFTPAACGSASMP